MKSLFFIISLMLTFVNVIKASINYYINNEQKQLITDCFKTNNSLFFNLNLDGSIYFPSSVNPQIKLVCFKGDLENVETNAEIVKSTYPLCNVNSDKYNITECLEYVNSHIIRDYNESFINSISDCFIEKEKAYFYYRELESGQYTYVCLKKTDSRAFEPCVGDGEGRYCNSYYEGTPSKAIDFYYKNLMNAVGGGIPIEVLLPPPSSSSNTNQTSIEKRERRKRSPVTFLHLRPNS